MKYFKKTYLNRPECPYGYGVWNNGDGVNYNPTDDYTIEDITEQEYIIGSAEVKAFYLAEAKEDTRISLKEKIHLRKAIKEDASEFENELNELTKETTK